MTNNPNCDGAHCMYPKGEVRVLPYSSDGNLILCYSCYLHEIAYRKERNKEVAHPFDLPKWEDLKIYLQY